MNGHDRDERDSDRSAVFESFKRGVAEVISPDDVTTHYDLGIAYLEMGMLEDATSEFQIVLRAAPTHALARAGLERATERLKGPPKSDPPGAS